MKIDEREYRLAVPAKFIGRPPLSEVPMTARHVVWEVEVTGPEGGAYYTDKVANIVNVICRPCALTYRAYEDDPRPCPGCSQSPVPDLPRGEIEAARVMVQSVRDFLTVINQRPGPGELSMLVNILTHSLKMYDASGGPAQR